VPQIASQFLDDLVLKKIEDRDCLWVVYYTLRFRSAETHRTYKVPSDFVTDLASIPRGLWNLFPKEGKQDRAAVLHDCGYAGCLIDVVGNPFTLNKKTIDRLFYEAMLSDGVGRKKAWLMWKAVSLVGRPHFGKQLS